MKTTQLLFPILLLFIFNACQKEPFEEQEAIQILSERLTVQPLEILHVPLTEISIPQGQYKGELQDKIVEIQVMNDEIWLFLPQELSLGENTLNWQIENQNYKLELQVVEHEKPLTLQALLINDPTFKKNRLDIETAIQNIPLEEQENLAQFIQVNQTLLSELYQAAPLVQNQKEEFKTNTLGVGQSITLDVDSYKHWNSSSLNVQQGETYTFSAQGTWTDLFFTSDADGYTNWYISLYNGLKRMQNENWFKLIGAIDQENLFAIGKSNTITMQHSGCLLYTSPSPRDLSTSRMPSSA